MIIKKLEDAQFANANKTILRIVSGYALYVEGKGYIAFSCDRDRFGILIPYIPQGGYNALQSIIDGGGFSSFDGMEYVQPYC